MSKLFKKNSNNQSELIEKIPTGKIVDIAKTVGKCIKGTAEVCVDKVKSGNAYLDAVTKSEKYLTDKYNARLHYDEKSNKYQFSLYSRDDNQVTKFMLPKRLIMQAIIQELIIKKKLG